MAVCRFCEKVRDDRGPLIAPCHCSHPDVRLWHTECLARWIRDGKPACCDYCGFKYAVTTKMRPVWKMRLAIAANCQWPCALLIQVLFSMAYITSACFWVRDVVYPRLLDPAPNCSDLIVNRLRSFEFFLHGAAGICFRKIAKWQAISYLFECFMRNREVYVENVGLAPTPEEAAEEGLAKPTATDDANSHVETAETVPEGATDDNHDICSRCTEEIHRKCHICEKAILAPHPSAKLVQLCYCKKVYHRACLYKKLREGGIKKCDSCSFQFLVAKGDRSHNRHHSHAFWAWHCTPIPSILCFLVGVASIPALTVDVSCTLKNGVIGSDDSVQRDLPIYVLPTWMMIQFHLLVLLIYLCVALEFVDRDNKFIITQDVSGKRRVLYNFPSGTFRKVSMPIDLESVKHMINRNLKCIAQEETPDRPWCWSMWTFPDPV